MKKIIVFLLLLSFSIGAGYAIDNGNEKKETLQHKKHKHLKHHKYQHFKHHRKPHHYPRLPPPPPRPPRP